MSIIRASNRNLKADPKKSIDRLTFLRFLMQKPQLMLLGIISIYYLAAYAILNYCYPTPNITADTSNYFACSNIHDFGGYRPVGHSWFLTFCNSFSRDFGFIALLQFALYVTAVLFFLFSIRYFFSEMNKYLFYGLVIFVTCNETIVYLTKWLISDSVYISYSLIWFTTLVWILHNAKNVFILLLHFIVLYLAMKTRYAALIYPVITALSVWWIYGNKGWLASMASLVILVIVYGEGVYEHRKQFGANTFSAFSGWAKANNATAILPYVEKKSIVLPSGELRTLNEILIQFPDSFYNEESVFATQFMWNSSFPGKTYMKNVRKRKPKLDYARNWVQTGVYLGRYANHLILHYPVEFFRYFLVKNFLRFVYPPEDIEKFSEGSKVDRNMGVNFKSDYTEFYSRYDIYYKFFAGFENKKYFATWLMIFIAIILVIVRRKKIFFNDFSQRTLKMLSLTIVLSGIFLIAAHPIFLRYVVHLSGFLALGICILTDTYLKAQV